MRPRAVTRDDRGGPPMALDAHIVEIARLPGVSLRRPKSSRRRRSGASSSAVPPQELSARD